RQVHEDEAADERVEELIRDEARAVGVLEAHVRAPGGGRALTGDRQRLLGAVDADDGAGRTDERRGEDRDVAGAAAQIPDAHPGTQAGEAQDLLAELAVELRLNHEPAVLVGRLSEWIRLGGSLH